jgi:hypothetical protein
MSFYGTWKEAKDVFGDFNIDPVEDAEFLLAWYDCWDYSGSAYVLFRDKSDGKLYELEGGHCSCNGLEGQWNPGEVTLEYLKNRLEKGSFDIGRSQYVYDEAGVGKRANDPDMLKAITEIIAKLDSERN